MAGNIPPTATFRNVVVRAVSDTGCEVQCLDGRCRTLPRDPHDTVGYSDMLCPGMQLNLLDATDDGTTLTPRYIIAEPDYLLDVSFLAECCHSFGILWQSFFAGRLLPRVVNHYILMGNAANLIFDEAVGTGGVTPSLQEITKKIFTAAPLEFAVSSGIDGKFFADLEAHYNNLQHVVKDDFPKAGLNKGEDMVEPTLISPLLGLRGRLDFLQRNGDRATGIELKSGRRYNGFMGDTHRVQLSLYQLMLHYALGVTSPDFYVLYSRYPQDALTKNILSETLMQQVLAARNRVVLEELHLAACDHPLRRLIEIFSNIRLDNPAAPLAPYVKKPVEQVAGCLIQYLQDPAAEAYFDRFYRFITRELLLAKMSRSTVERTGVTALWQASMAQKRAMGCVIAPMLLQESHAAGEEPLLRFSYTPRVNEAISKFRPGDIVLLYGYTGEECSVVSSVLHRGVLVSITSSEVVVRLRDRQHCPSLFTPGDNFVLEADYSDASFKSQFAGLYAFLATPPARRNLLLGGGDYHPATGAPAVLVHQAYSQQINDIIANATGTGEMYLLMGPPGTGKTSVALMGMVRQIMDGTQENLLLVAYTNRAVDEICARLDEEKTLEYIRLGVEDSCAEWCRNRLLPNALSHCTCRNEVVDYLRSCRLYVASLVTLLSKPELFAVKHFGTCIIDEASQLLEPQLLGLFAATDASGNLAIDRFVLIGDYNQLPAIVIQDASEAAITHPALQACGLSDCRMSLFERLYRRYCHIPQLTGMLSHQWRMHPDIVDFVSHCFYGDRLQIGGAPHQQGKLPFEPAPGMTAHEKLLATTRVAFIDVPPTGEEMATNVSEAQVVAHIVQAYYKLHTAHGIEMNPATAIGIITPYRNQIVAIRAAIESMNLPGSDHIRIDTVERFQGSQNDLVIFSCAVLNDMQLAFLSTCHDVDGMLVDRKLNVAITRAREQLVIVGHRALLQHSPIYRHLLQYITERGVVV